MTTTKQVHEELKTITAPREPETTKTPPKKLLKTKQIKEKGVIQRDKEKTISSLLKTYNSMEDKKDCSQGRRLRRQLRRLGYYLSKQNTD